MNQARQAANGQEEICEIYISQSPYGYTLVAGWAALEKCCLHTLHCISHLQRNVGGEAGFRLHRALCELQRLLISHLGLTCQGRMRSQVASPIQEHQNERGFNWECPGKVEYETVRDVLKQQKQLMQQECIEGKGTSQRKLVLDLLRSLWIYLLFKSKSEENEQLNSVRCSLFRHEWREVQQQNDILDRGTTFKQHLRMLITYLTDLTAGRRTDDSQATRYNEEINSGDVNPEL